MTGGMRLDELLSGNRAGAAGGDRGPHARFARGRRGRRLRRAAGRPRARARARCRSRRARRARHPLGSRGRARTRCGGCGSSLRRGDRAARPPRRHRGPVLRHAVVAAHGRRRHRHQRQDDLRMAARLGGRAPRAARRLPRHARRGISAAGGGRGADHAGRRLAAPAAALARGRRREPRRDGSVLARTRPAPRRRRAPARRRIQQPVAGSPRLPRDDGALCRGEVAPVPAARPGTRRHQCRRPGWRALCRRAARRRRADRGRRRRRSAGGRAFRARRPDPGRGPRSRARHPRALRRAAPPFAVDRRVQRREPRRHARRAFGVAIRRGRFARGARRMRRAAGPHGRLPAAERRARGGRLRAHARRARQGARRRCARTRAAACWSCSDAAASAIPASAR